MNEHPTHDLKIHPVPFAAVCSGLKAFEIRRDDRGFQVGDGLLLREWDPLARTYTGEEVRRTIAYIGRNCEACLGGLADGYVVLGLAESTHPAEADLQRLGGLLHDLAELLGVPPVFGDIEEEAILAGARRLAAVAGPDAPARLLEAHQLVQDAAATFLLGSGAGAKDKTAQAAVVLQRLIDGRA